ncbi:probable G-protein coupled receptor 139 isoform X2 [Lingula anatina]|uniref:Probable G-protein coupled receptor 139 isoform X2 n=1 Tax=Lingula anatina TaxID=7574 RepID=A0A1S3K6M5_LINAN|nr:probable G-protein coupled receptor 139 isoform X2 [Lingula anatina]XP_013418079.1 probable G-protein coupled receptor 139 isoform X2 [Lingula anatina]|eukprot:XP_013388409.1 probable G-protein coupled receptor 139 isoform X2 [Lingula anatina]
MDVAYNFTGWNMSLPVNVSEAGMVPIDNRTDDFFGSNQTWSINNVTNGSDITPDPNGSVSRSEIDIYQVHLPLKITLEQWVPIVYYIFGLSGNFLAFIVWIQRRMQHSSGCYLAALALSDLCFLLLHMLYEIHYIWGHKVFNANGACQIFAIVFMWTQHMSPMFVLAFTIERYLAVCHPFKRDKICTKSLAIKVIVSITVVCLLIDGMQGYFWTYVSKADDCDVRGETLIGGVGSVWSVWSWVTEILIFAVVPLLVLIFNILVIHEARKLSENEKIQLQSRKGRRTSTTTFMLLAVSFFLIFTTLPVTIVYNLYAVFQQGDPTLSDEEIHLDQKWQAHLKYTAIKTLVQYFGMAHYACNFYIYCITGKMFRKELVLIFKRVFRIQIPGAWETQSQYEHEKVKLKTLIPQQSKGNDITPNGQCPN